MSGLVLATVLVLAMLAGLIVALAIEDAKGRN
jgi:hypothetical protein